MRICFLIAGLLLSPAFLVAADEMRTLQPYDED
jgi:hypothetical protein